MNKQTEALNGLKHLESISAQLKTYSDQGQWTHIPSHLSAGHCYEIAKEMDNVIQACKEALAQPAQEHICGDRPAIADRQVTLQSNNIVRDKQGTIIGHLVKSRDELIEKAREEGRELERRKQPAQEPVAWMKNAIENARDVCKYLDHDMVEEAKEHTKFFWNDLDKIREFDDTHSAPQPAQEPAAFNIHKKADELLKTQREINRKYGNAPSWQGLRDDEIKRNATKLGYLWTENSEISFKMDGFLELFARAIEQALKEKNHG